MANPHVCGNFNRFSIAGHLQASLNHLEAALGGDPCPDAPMGYNGEHADYMSDPFLSTASQYRDILITHRQRLEDLLALMKVSKDLERESREQLVRYLAHRFDSGMNIGAVQAELGSHGYPSAKVIISADGLTIDFGDDE